MGRCIAVVGIPRSGTSCVAGVLHRLGVNMGAGHFQNKDKFNPTGYWEDLRWRQITHQITGRGYSTQGYLVEQIPKKLRRQYRELARQCDRQPLWGMKDPRLCFVGKFIFPHLSDLRIIATVRNYRASVASVQKHIQKSYKGKYQQTAEEIMDRWRGAYWETLQVGHYPALVVDYDELITHARSQVELIKDFVFDGLDQKPDGKMSDILSFISPRLRHFK